MKIACCQLKCKSTKEQTLSHVEEFIINAKQNLADVIVLPEMFICPYEYKNFPVYAESEDGFIVHTLSSLAKKYSVYLFAGTIPEQCGEKMYNTCFVFDRAGSIIGKYRKKHLFDIDIKGQITFKESDYMSSGIDDCVVDIDGIKMGVLICFDVRFPHEFSALRKKGVDVFILPACFNMTTGPVHWELLLRARATDNQSYLVACASALDESSEYKCYGHSSIISPWGEVIAQCEQEESILYSDVDVDYIQKVRNQIPLSLSLSLEQ